MKRSTRAFLFAGAGLSAAGLLPGSIAAAEAPQQTPSGGGETTTASVVPATGTMAVEYTIQSSDLVAVPEATIAKQETPSLAQDPFIREMAGLIVGAGVLGGAALAVESAISRRRMTSHSAAVPQDLQA